MSLKAVHFGAGNIGRGFVGLVLHNAGYELVFADVAAPLIDAHSLAPDAIFALLASLGGRPRRSLVVACEPADTGAGMGLSEPVQAALPHAVRAVEDILRDHRTEGKGDQR